jgi:hypothetical protein
VIAERMDSHGIEPAPFGLRLHLVCHYHAIFVNVRSLDTRTRNRRCRG